MATFGPNYTTNKAIIDNQITSGSTILASSFQTVLGDLNLAGNSMGAFIGNSASFSAPFDQNATLVENIKTAYQAAIAGLTTAPDPGAVVYKYKNLGGF